MMGRIFWNMYLSTLQKEVRSKTLIFVFLLTCLTLGVMASMFSYFFQSDTFQALAPMIGDRSTDFFFLFIAWWSGILAMIFSCGCVSSDIKNKVIDQILSFPIRRSEYFLARVLGALSISQAYFVFFSLVGLVVFQNMADNLSVSPGHLLLFVLLSLPGLAAVSLLGALFSLYAGRTFSLIGVFVFSWILRGVNISMADQGFEGLNVWKTLGLAGHWLFPRISIWDEIALEGLTSKAFSYNVLWESGHYLLAMGLWLSVSLYCLGRKQF